MFVQVPENATMQPLFLDERSATTRHLPFLMGLVQVLRPKCTVELGVQRGSSFFAICQSLGLGHGVQHGVEAWAVDHWEGDDHTGRYGEDVFQEFRERELQIPFATALRNTFLDARLLFESKSVDLLHVDGFHSYDQVRQDWAVWESAMKPGGVVLFHDICVDKPGFGVKQFWEELRERNRHRVFELNFGAGLGGLVLPEAEECVGRFCYESEHVTSAFNSVYQSLGERARTRSLAPPPDRGLSAILSNGA